MRVGGGRRAPSARHRPRSGGCPSSRTRFASSGSVPQERPGYRSSLRARASASGRGSEMCRVTAHSSASPWKPFALARFPQWLERSLVSDVDECAGSPLSLGVAPTLQARDQGRDGVARPQPTEPGDCVHAHGVVGRAEHADQSGAGGVSCETEDVRRGTDDVEVRIIDRFQQRGDGARVHAALGVIEVVINGAARRQEAAMMTARRLAPEDPARAGSASQSTS